MGANYEDRKLTVKLRDVFMNPGMLRVTNLELN